MNVKRFLKSHFWIGVILISSASGWTGYWFRGQCTDGSLSMRPGAILGQDYLTAPDSFSRVENTRQNLEALCLRERLVIQNAILAHQESMKKFGTSTKGMDFALNTAIDDAERAMREFEGTDQELGVAQDLLLALKTAGRFDYWTEVYLKALYRYPTHPVVARFARDAISIGKLAGQQESVLSGLKLVSTIPLDFEGKYMIQAALGAVQPAFGLTHIETTIDPAGQ